MKVTREMAEQRMREEQQCALLKRFPAVVGRFFGQPLYELRDRSAFGVFADQVARFGQPVVEFSDDAVSVDVLLAKVIELGGSPDNVVCSLVLTPRQVAAIRVETACNARWS